MTSRYIWFFSVSDLFLFLSGHCGVTIRCLPQPNEALTMFFQGPMMSFWESISSKYLIYTCTDPVLKAAVSCCRPFYHY
jgi:hypothetical protein